MHDMSNTSSNPWQQTRFDFPADLPTMITPEERQYLYWLGADVWQGEGYVVEIGPWLGGSTWCLAAGMRQSGHPIDKRLVVYDNFVWRDFMSSRTSLDLKPGDCFQSEFQKNLQEFESTIDSWKQTLPDEVIEHDREAHSKRYTDSENVPLFRGVPGSDPVEILFIDGAKSWMGQKHLLLHVAERMIPGKSILVCQDFKYWGNYWVPMLSAMLGDDLQPIHNVRTATTLTSRLLQPLRTDWLEALPDHIGQVSTEEGLRAIDEAARMLQLQGDLRGAANVQLGKVMFLSHQNHVDEAVAAFRQSQEHWPRGVPTSQLERARTYLAESRSVYVLPGLIPRARQMARSLACRLLAPLRRG